MLSKLLLDVFINETTDLFNLEKTNDDLPRLTNIATRSLSVYDIQKGKKNGSQSAKRIIYLHDIIKKQYVTYKHIHPMPLIIHHT